MIFFAKYGWPMAIKYQLYLVRSYKEVYRPILASDLMHCSESLIMHTILIVPSHQYHMPCSVQKTSRWRSLATAMCTGDWRCRWKDAWIWGSNCGQYSRVLDWCMPSAEWITAFLRWPAVYCLKQVLLASIRVTNGITKGIWPKLLSYIQNVPLHMCTCLTFRNEGLYNVKWRH